MIDEYGAVSGMRIGRGNRSTKSAPVSLCPQQVPHDLISKPGRRCRKSASNRLSYGTVLLFFIIIIIWFVRLLWAASGDSEDDCGEADGM
jgi:hypothetical protein